jgi:hypothetical protein
MHAKPEYCRRYAPSKENWDCVMTEEMRGWIRLVAAIGLMTLLLIDFVIISPLKSRGLVRLVVTSAVGFALVSIVLWL